MPNVVLDNDWYRNPFVLSLPKDIDLQLSEPTKSHIVIEFDITCPPELRSSLLQQITETFTLGRPMPYSINIDGETIYALSDYSIGEIV